VTLSTQTCDECIYFAGQEVSLGDQSIGSRIDSLLICTVFDDTLSTERRHLSNVHLEDSDKKN
jgi:hypothetical protein